MMMILFLGILGVAAVIATIVQISRDGYGRRPTRYDQEIRLTDRLS